MINFVRLITGEELIAEVENNGVNGYYLKNILQLSLVPPKSPGSGPGLALTPWLIYLDNKNPVNVRYDCVVVVHKPIPEVEEAYKQAFSKIIQAKSQLIMP